MNIKTLAKAIVIYTANKKRRYRGLVKSYISLFLVVTLFITSTTAWFITGSGISIDTQGFKYWGVPEGFEYDPIYRNSTIFEIPACTLGALSSVDGTNLFVPVSGSQDGSTGSMRFRNANAADKNSLYAYTTAKISSNPAKDTYAYIKSYSVKVSGIKKIPVINYKGEITGYDTNKTIEYKDELMINSTKTMQSFNPSCPIRIAIITNRDNESRLLDPSALVNDYAENTYSVAWVTNDGTPFLKKTDAKAFSNYYYKGNDSTDFEEDNCLFTIKQGEDIDVTIVAWLEGTHSLANDFAGAQVELSVEIESNMSKMVQIKLKDNTSNNWLSNDSPNIVISYMDGEIRKTAMMIKSGNYYVATIPDDIKNDIWFCRLSPMKDTLYEPDLIFKGTVYNAWYAQSRGNRTIYYATEGNSSGIVKHDDPNKYRLWLAAGTGYWG